MKSRITLLTLAYAAVLLAQATAQAADSTFQQVTANGSGEYLWSNANNWDLGHVPDATERAIIPTGLTCYVDYSAAVADRVRIEGTGTLNIKASSKLTLDSDGTTSEVAASGSKIQLLGSGAELAFISHAATISGPGELNGQDAGALLTVDGVALTNALSSTGITGKMQIVNGSSNGTFINQGIVDANASGVLAVSINNVQSTSSDRRWRSTAAGAKLDFSAGSYTSMAGGLYLMAGEIEVNGTALTTAGRLEASGGTLDVNAALTMGSAGNFMNADNCLIDATDAQFIHN
jgi:hypothetical protein